MKNSGRSLKYPFSPRFLLLLASPPGPATSRHELGLAMRVLEKCKELPDDGNEQWVDDGSRSQYERMIQLSTPSLDSESGSTPISVEEDFVSVMGKDQSGHIRCGGSRETRRTWYGTGEGSSSTNYQQQISNIENTLRMEVEELRTEACRWDSEMDEMGRELEQLRKRESEMDDIQVETDAEMKTSDPSRFLVLFHWQSS
ncbi:hypothetical protein Taro_055903 [Colocasia esculenta]|uniref:Uncharacterized protein n=1 Tax=Colocasia esculenta TaxID=4460 RepID=A0A843XVN4_COLES|nr:hypothetical protein [Colocasia esculenta]